MANLFPLQLSASKTLLELSPILSAALTNTEAWLNFQTMGLNWFADEANSPRFRYRFVSQEELNLQSNDGLAWQHEAPNSAFIAQSQSLNCVILIALTEEIAKLSEQIAIENILRERLVEVTNARAQVLNFEPIGL
ncbi:hypothetical protein LP316_05550 [Thalassotalea sp. LPB0316]|uniref:hypothetical protein n=1 Tax=Thalassotalea sp. LPB0316 TaxID=2769490 RepID=UPI001865C679|nr:hypothetical protein [Thalassotalea sp. LPB0316]QOL26765.1 hypothetical protein LP316_05550 [Thalassotalea sp. LPB0316]